MSAIATAAVKQACPSKLVVPGVITPASAIWQLTAVMVGVPVPLVLAAVTTLLTRGLLLASRRVAVSVTVVLPSARAELGLLSKVLLVLSAGGRASKVISRV